MKINFIKKHNLLVPLTNDDVDKIDGFKEGAIYQCEVKNMDTRTIAQNRLIHQFCKNVAEEARSQNFTLKQLVKDGTPLSMLSTKELIFKPTIMSLYGKDSTTKLNKNEFDLIFDTIILGLGQYGLDTSKLLYER